MDYFLMTTDQLEGVQRLEMKSIQVTKMRTLIIDHWYLQSHNSGNPFLFSKRQSNTYHISNMTLCEPYRHNHVR